MPSAKRWLVTGGLGFIGSQFIRMVLRERLGVEIVNLDAMTYAANPVNLDPAGSSHRYRFVKGDIADPDAVREAIGPGVDVIVNFAAESHVDRALLDAEPFRRTNVDGVRVLLDAALERGVRRFVQVSTDEVYGEILEGESAEEDELHPRNPYSETKAQAEELVLRCNREEALPVVITRGSNTYGPYQHPEKFIPLFVTNLIDGEPAPLYGDGLQVREWLHAGDHARGILHLLERGKSGEIYNLGGGNPRTNLDVAKMLLDACGRSASTHLRHVEDRAGHDRRYAMSSAKARKIGWKPHIPFPYGLRRTVDWYKANDQWWRAIKSGEFAAYYERQYGKRYSEGA